jgi:nucleoside-diphosphate-sugar epimerase
MSGNLPSSADATVLIWGATGFVGINLAAYLRTRVKKVLAVGRDGVLTESIDDKDNVIAINLAATRYDAQGFQHKQSTIFSQNVEIATHFYHFCLNHDIKEARVASSIAVYPESETLLDDAKPIDRDVLPAASEAMYGCSKRIAEDIAGLYHTKYGINSIQFRLSNPYGPHDSLHIDRAHVLAAFVMRALTTSGPFTVRGGPDATRDFIYVRDVCDIFYKSLAMRGTHGAYNMATGGNTKIIDLATLVVKLTDPSRPITFEGSPTSSVVHRVSKVERLKRDFAIDRFTALETGLGETIDWYRTKVK